MIPLIKWLVKSLEVFIRELYPVQWSPGQKTPASLHRRSSWFYLLKQTRTISQNSKTQLLLLLMLLQRHCDIMGTGICLLLLSNEQTESIMLILVLLSEVVITWRCYFIPYTTMFSTVNLCKEWNDTTTACLTLQKSFCLKRTEQMWRENTGTHRSRSTGTVPAGLEWSSLSGTRSDPPVTVWADLRQISLVRTLSFWCLRSVSFLLSDHIRFYYELMMSLWRMRLRPHEDEDTVSKWQERSPWQHKFVCLFVLPQLVSLCYVCVTTVVSWIKIVLSYK